MDRIKKSFLSFLEHQSLFKGVLFVFLDTFAPGGKLPCPENGLFHLTALVREPEVFLQDIFRAQGCCDCLDLLLGHLFGLGVQKVVQSQLQICSLPAMVLLYEFLLGLADQREVAVCVEVVIGLQQYHIVASAGTIVVESQNSL